MNKVLGAHSDRVYALLRIVVGFLYLCHGAQKLFGAFGGMGPNGGTVSLMSKMGAAGTIEFACGLLMALGLYAGYAAFVASGEMAVAYFTVHFGRGWFPILNGGEMAVFYSWIFLFIATRGSGIWSLDGVLRRS